MKKLIALLTALMLLMSMPMMVSAAESEVPYSASWSISATSDIGDTIGRAFDGDASTYWHSKYTAEGGTVVSHEECPHTVTVEFGETKQISGWIYTPRTDNGAGTIQEYNIYASADGTTYKKIYTGSFDYGEGAANDHKPESASWGNVAMKGIKIEVTKSVGSYGTASEITFLTGGSGTAIQNGDVYKEPAKSTVQNAGAQGTQQTGAAATSSATTIPGKVIPFNSSWMLEVNSALTPIERAFDGDPGTYWHSNYTAEGGTITSHDTPPFDITVTFPTTQKVSGWLYTPRNDNATGVVTSYDIYASANGISFDKIYSGTFDYSDKNFKDNPQGASWGDKDMRAIRIEITNGLGTYGTAGEITFYTGGEAVAETKKEQTTTGQQAATASGASSATATSKSGLPLLSRTGWKATASSEKGSNVGKIFDGDVGTYWHTDYTADGGTITGHDLPPFDLEITLPKAETMSGIILTPRTDNKTGVILLAELYVSDSDDGDYFMLKELEFDDTQTPHEVLFTANLTIKRIKIHVLSGQGGYSTLAEFDAIGKDDTKETVTDFALYAENEEENRLYKINSSMFTAEYDGANWGENTPTNALDGSEKTFWQTDSLPKDTAAVLTVDMREVTGVKQIDYLPRQTTDLHGCWTNLNIWASNDGVNWTPAMENIELPKDLTLKSFIFEKDFYTRYLQFEIFGYHASRVSCAELTFYQSKEAKDKALAGNFEKYVLSIGSKDIQYEKPDGSGTTTIDVAPYIVAGSTMIPLRGLVEQMGAAIEWDGDTQTIFIDNGYYEITLQIWNHLVYVKDPKYGDLRYTLLNVPVITENRTFIPVRFVSEQLGYHVEWDGEAQTVTITKE